MFAVIDRNGTSHELDILGDGNCNKKENAYDIEQIKEKDWLPLKGFSYGPFQKSRATAYLNIGPLHCSFAPGYQQINFKRAIIGHKHQIQNLEVN